jgi:ferritin-like metal-binding protein YciE
MARFAWAEELGYSKSVTLLQQTFDEERAPMLP